MPELVHLQLDQHMAFQDAMVEHQIHEKRLAADEQTLLTRLKTETVAQFEQEGLQLLDQGRFQIGLRQNFLGSQAEKLENIRVPDDMLRFGAGRSGADDSRKARLVAGKPRTLEVQTTDLPPQFAHRPVALDALDLIEGPFERIVNFQQKFKMAVPTTRRAMSPSRQSAGSIPISVMTATR
jgi:ParB-like chromosome segregation protein Spo0J